MSSTTAVVTFIVLILNIMLIRSQVVREAFYNVFEKHRVYEYTTKIVEIPVKSSVLCTLKCLEIEDCIAANFNSVTKNCAFHRLAHRTDTIPLNDDTQLKAIVKSEFQVYDYAKTWRNFGAPDCYLGHKDNYSGNMHTTTSGRTCQNWNVNYPHTVNELPLNPADHNTNYCRVTSPGGFLGCYTTDPGWIWDYCSVVHCFACGVIDSLPPVIPNTPVTRTYQVHQSSSVLFECTSLENGVSENHCPVSVCNNDQWSFNYNVSCKSEDCYTTSQTYKGKMSCTISGIRCQHWNTNTYHNADNKPLDPNDLASNYCRDPDNTLVPWCYTTDPAVRWEPCPVKKC